MRRLARALTAVVVPGTLVHQRRASVLTSLPKHVQPHSKEPPPAPPRHRSSKDPEAEEDAAATGGLALTDTLLTHARLSPDRPALLKMYDWRLRAVSQQGSLLRDSPSLPDVRVHGNRLQRLPPAEHPALEAYRQKYLDLIRMEESALVQEAEERLAKTKPDPGEGLTLWDLEVQVTAERVKEDVIVQLTADAFGLARHQFRSGMACWISKFVPGRPNEPVQKGEAAMGYISRIFGDRIDVSVKSRALGQLPARCRLDYAFDPTVIQRMTEAMDALIVDRKAQHIEQHRMDKWANYKPRDKRISLLQRGTDLVDLVALSAQDKSNGSDLFVRDPMIRSWALRHSFERPLMRMPGDPDLGSLNPIQVRAIALALQHRLTLIQGPPGTGKSETITQIVRLLKVHFQVACPILVCAPTNAAVDNLVSAFARKGLKPLRMGRDMRIREDCQWHSFSAAKKRHSLYGDLLKKEGEIENITVELLHMGFKSTGPKAFAKKLNVFNEEAALARRDELKKARKARDQLSRKIASDAINGSDAVLSTTFGGTEKALDQVDFPFVLVDEAAQCNEPATLIPMMKGCKHAILVGDHKQLTGMNKSEEAAMKGFNNSLFERLISDRGVASIMLQEQYRMARDIVDFPNQEFYRNRLTTGGQGHKRLNTVFLKPGRTVAFLHHEHLEAHSARSMHNLGEGELVRDVVEDLLQKNPDLRPHEIGIISPYAAQTTFLRELRLTGLHPDVEVHTVDGFQGREKRAIVLSTVRSNSKKTIGFLQDPRRLNVALTRARDALLIVGNRDTLSAGVERDANDVWSSLMKWLESEDLIAPWRPSTSFQGR